MSRERPELSTSDIKAWRRLVSLAQDAAAEPAARCGDLQKAEKTARKAVVIGVLGPGNACVVLVRASRQFVAETVRGRRELAQALADAAKAVEVALETASADPPRLRRPRADVDG